MTPQLRPGLPGYTGPKSGLFAVIHHGELFEYSHDVFERLDYIDKKKPENERKTRRENILYLGECPALAEYDKALAEYDKALAEYDKALAEYDQALAEYDKAQAECYKALAECYKAQAEYDKAWAEYDKAWAEYDKAQAEYDKAWAEYDKAAATVDHAAVLSYIRQHIPDFPWDGKQLVFPT